MEAFKSSESYSWAAVHKTRSREGVNGDVRVAVTWACTLRNHGSITLQCAVSVPERARVYCRAWLAIGKYGEGWEGVVGSGGGAC